MQSGHTIFSGFLLFIKNENIAGTPSFYQLQLVRGKPIIVDANSPFDIQEVGNFFIITTPSGITLTWDKGTRVYLKLSTDHKGQVSDMDCKLNRVYSEWVVEKFPISFFLHIFFARILFSNKFTIS